MSVVEELSGDGSRIVTSWKRTTVADGDWLQHNTIGPLNERDVFLAEKIDELSGNADEKLNEEIRARIAGDTYLSSAIVSISSDFYPFSANVETSAAELNNKIDTVYNETKTASGILNSKITQTNTRIDNLEAATDVIAVFGTYEEFTAASASTWQQTVTDNDFIKVIRDDNYQPNTNDHDYQTTDDDVYQVYYEYHKTNHDGWIGWSAIGSLDPYYSVSEIDDKERTLSAIIANNYLSANNTAVSAGKNIIVTNETGTKVGIKTKDDVSFSNVSATGFSGTNLSGLNQHDTIDNLFASAHSGAEASAWIYANSAILDIQPGYGLTYDINEQGNKVIGIRQDHCDYYGHSLALGSYSTANGDNSYAFGMSCVTNGSNALAIGDNARATTGAIALGTYNSAIGKYSLALGYNSSAINQFSVAIGRGLSGEAPITLGTWNDNVAGATFIIGDGTGTQEGFDVVRKNALVIKDGLVSGRDFSAGDVSLSSLTNLSAFGNGITNTATFNLSAIKLSAGEGIGFKNDTNGVLSISAEGRAYTGENYVKVDNTTKKIGLSGNLVGSAESGQSAYNWITTKSATLSAGSGIVFNSAAQNTLGISVNYTTTDGYVTELNGVPLSAGANYTQGRCIEIDSDNSIKLSANVSATSYYTYEGATTDFSACTISSNGIEFIRGGSNTNYPYYRNALEGTSINIRYDNKNGGIEDVDFKSSTIVYSQTARAPGITFSVTGNWSNIISASKLTPGSGIEIIHTTNDNEIYLTANKYTYQTTATQEGRPVVIPHEVTACSSLELRATYPENPTDVAKNVIVLYNNTAVGCLIPTPPSYSYGQHNNYYLAAKPSGPNSQERHWEPVSSITANCISGNGTITAMITATQPGSNANVLYLI